ncbi:MBL fold metallo-hydrolase [Patescibacteria group bacterium]|nr:MBL fold metallo-hydrolase [Patescibacteria group bacterium]MBU4512700.1 MBL fold metallo-hydrolase [Patescibacteria group bacterium]MCG2693602.1 MBL fold metallo-hydrolase [Candidatus Parcubacteria bacterium]
MQPPKKLLTIIITLILLALGLGGYVWIVENQQTNLEVIALDIGQGDAILIKTPYRQNILIDGGPDNSVVRGIDGNLPFWRRRIDLMILTHPDADHVTGLVEVLERYPVERVMSTGVVHTLPAYIEWLEIIKDEQIPMDIARAPMKVEFGDDLWLEIIYPWEDYVGINVEDNNETSIVVKLIYGETSFLLTGDATIKSEEEMLSAGIDVNSDVLKVGHHGSKGSTCLEFAQAVEPEYAVISVGADNRFGHPNLRVLKNLEAVGAIILRTDKTGDIILVSDGETVSY